MYKMLKLRQTDKDSHFPNEWIIVSYVNCCGQVIFVFRKIMIHCFAPNLKSVISFVFRISNLIYIKKINMKKNVEISHFISYYNWEL